MGAGTSAGVNLKSRLDVIATFHGASRVARLLVQLAKLGVAILFDLQADGRGRPSLQPVSPPESCDPSPASFIPGGVRSFMKIGILGSGMVGQTLAAGFLKHGHRAMLGTRDTDKGTLQDWRSKNPTAQVGTFEEAAKFGDLMVLCSLGRAAVEVLRLAGPDNLAGKTIIDTTNPLAGTPPVEGVIAYTTGPNQSLAEEIQAAVPRSHILKA